MPLIRPESNGEALSGQGEGHCPYCGQTAHSWTQLERVVSAALNGFFRLVILITRA